MVELIGSLDVEVRARAKDNHEKGVESSAANMVQKKNSFAYHNKKKKNMQENNNAKPKQTAQFKKKNNKKGGGCFMGVMSIGQVRAQTVNINKKRNQQTW